MLKKGNGVQTEQTILAKGITDQKYQMMSRQHVLNLQVDTHIVQIVQLDDTDPLLLTLS